MQLMVLGDESPRMLRLCSQFLLDAAQLAEAERANGGPLLPATPGPTVDEATLDNASDSVIADIVAPAPQPVDPRVVFGLRPEIGVGGAARLDTSAPVSPPLPFNAAPPPPPPPSVANSAEGGAAPPLLVAHNPDTAVQLDKRGFPHDSRIHSETPTIKKDGEWRQRRNLNNATLVAVENELIAKGYGPTAAAGARFTTPAAAQVPLPPAVIPPPPPVVAAPNAPAAPVIPPPPPAQVMVPPPPPVVGSVPAGTDASAPDPFRALMKFVEGQTGEGGRYSLERMKPVHAEFGAGSWADYYGKCRDKIPALRARLETM